MNEMTSPQSTTPKAPLAQGSHVRTPELIGAEIRMYVDAGRRVTLLCGIEIGRRLREAKELLDHGQWLPWLEKETEFSERTAQRYMRVFEEYGAAQLGFFGPETNATTLSDLPITKALALLSVPESDREDFAARVDAEHLSTRELQLAIRERDEALKRARDAEEELKQLGEGQDLALAELEEQLAEARKEADKGKAAQKMLRSAQDDKDALERQLSTARDTIRELESRPVEVAVQRDEEAIQEAVTAAKAAAASEWSGKLSKLETALRKAEKEKSAAEDKAKKAAGENSQAVRDAEQALERTMAELEEARKKLKASNAEVAKFGVYFQRVQEDINRMLEQILEIAQEDERTADKLRLGARTILRKTLERLGG